MIDESTEVSTGEICALADLSKQRLGQLEANGVIKRAGRDRWLLASTLRALFVDARTRSAQHSEARSRLADARAKALELRTLREAGELLPTGPVENYVRTCFGMVRVEHSALPAAYTRDREARQKLEDMLNQMDTRLADLLDKEGDKLWLEAQKAARRRS